MVRIMREEGIRPETSFFHAGDGFSYHFNKVMAGGRVSLRCINYKRGRCYARASCNPDGREFRQGRTRHRCLPNHYFVHCRRFRSALINDCKDHANANLTLKEIYDRTRRGHGFPRQAILSIPFIKIRPSMQRARESTLPPVPHTLSELANILEQDRYSFLTRTLDKEDSIYAGKFGQTAQRTRVIIFASQRMLRYMADVQNIFSDATFGSVPAGLECFQIWNIITLRRHHIIPLVRVFMQSKLQACYEVALRAIATLLPNWRPRSVMCDFEFAQANAWSIVFPTVDVDGCLFHSTKSIAGRAKELQLTDLIRDNEEADSVVRSLCALALLPHWLLDEGLETIAVRCGEAQLMLQLEDLLVYVRDTWYTPARKRMFSVYNREDRTNNGSESGNAALRAAMRQVHPNTWSCMFGLLHLEDVANFDVAVLNTGFAASVLRRSSALANDEAIKGLTEDLIGGHITVDAFLRTASRRLQNVYNVILDL